MSVSKQGVLNALAFFKGEQDSANDNKFVAKVEGKGLSTEDYTTAEKNKLEGITPKAQPNTIEIIKVNNVALSPTSDTKIVNIDLSGYAQKSDVTSALIYKGTVANFKDLPTSGNQNGHVYNITNAGGTGATTAAAARNNLGLGNTTGALPVANGGTGQTALSAVTGVGSALAVSNTVTGSNSANLLYAKVADSDYFRLRVGGTAANAGYVEIATADDSNEPVYVRQYSGEFTTVKRTATLLDANGNTSFPGTTVSAAAFSVPGGLAVANGGTGNTIGAAQQFVSLVSDSNSTFRNVWFGSNASSLKAAYDSDFQYNPSTNILNVQNINGTSITISGGMTSGGTIKSAAVSVSGGVTTVGTLTGAAASLSSGGVITTGTVKGAAVSVSGGVSAVGSVTGAGVSVSGDISATNVNATNLNVTNLVLSSTESEVDNALWIEWS